MNQNHKQYTSSVSLNSRETQVTQFVGLARLDTVRESRSLSLKGSFEYIEGGDLSCMKDRWEREREIVFSRQNRNREKEREADRDIGEVFIRMRQIIEEIVEDCN